MLARHNCYGKQRRHKRGEGTGTVFKSDGKDVFIKNRIRKKHAAVYEKEVSE